MIGSSTGRVNGPKAQSETVVCAYAGAKRAISSVKESGERIPTSDLRDLFLGYFPGKGLRSRSSATITFGASRASSLRSGEKLIAPTRAWPPPP
jgi:hypothetical protein